jgi:Sulfotransferase family
MKFEACIDQFHEQAMNATSLDDFGSDDYLEPMGLLLSDYDEYNQFSEAGATMVAQDIVGKLIGRLVTEAGFKAYPEFAGDDVCEPIIIAGMARTGSTAALRLLTQDAANQGLELWLSCLPMPRPPQETWPGNAGYRQVVAQFDQLYKMNPAIKRIHPMVPDRPDECRFALDQSFWSPSFATTACTPNYTKWLLSCDASFAYRRYRRILGLVAGGDKRRWVLKDPSHIFGLDALIAVFPDACFVQTHRDPAVSLTSVASLIFELRKLREPALTPEQNGREQLQCWASAIEKAEVIRRANPSIRYFDLMFSEIAEHPQGAMERLYHRFGLPVSVETIAAWRKIATDSGRGGHGEHRYQAERQGFTAEQARSLTPNYVERLTLLEALDTA